MLYCNCNILQIFFVFLTPSGTLPTFLEVSESFTSDQVSEDTLLWQLWRLKIANQNASKLDRREAPPLLKLKSVVLGDSTWVALFRQNIDRGYPFPSFDVQDLDTLDDGVLSKIWNELQT